MSSARAGHGHVAAEPFLWRALSAQEKLLAPIDPNLAQCLESCAALLRKTGWDDEAGAMEVWAQRIRAARAKR